MKVSFWRFASQPEFFKLVRIILAGKRVFVKLIEVDLDLGYRIII